MGRSLGVANSTADIDSGVINGATIGQTSAAAVTATIFKATTSVAFFDASLTAQPSGAAQAAVSTAAATTGSAIYGFTSAQANGIVSLLNQIRGDLVTLGLIKGS